MTDMDRNSELDIHRDLIRAIADFFLYAEGQTIKKELLEFIDIHIDAMRRHDHDPQIIKVYQSFFDTVAAFSDDLPESSRDPLRSILGTRTPDNS